MNKKKDRKRRLPLYMAIIAGIIAFIVIMILQKSSSDPIEISYTEFLQKIENQSFATITIEEDSSTVSATEIDKETDETKKYVTKVPSMDEFVSYLHLQIKEDYFTEIKMIESSSNSIFLDFFILFLPLILWIISIFVMIKTFKKVFGLRNTNKDTKNNNTPSFSNPLNTDINYTEKVAKSNVKFSDVAGLDEEKAELQEIVDFMKNPEKYVKLGAKIPKGVLLSGAPGTGKTLLAKAVAGEADVSFVAISGSEFVEKYVGVGASRIRNLFREARQKAPCIIFIDEIDAVGSMREDGGNSEYHQTLEQLLTELDGFADQTNIVVIGATNRLSSLDPALTRPGRFDRNITVHLPDVTGREEILKIHARKKPFETSINFKTIALNTAGYSGAELANLLNEAALIAARREHKVILEEDIDEALRKITIGLKKAGRVISEKEKKLTSVHESGHAILSRLLKSESSVKEISIIPRGTNGGYTWHNRVEDKSYTSKTELQKELIILLGGRVAERIVLGDISSGASHDLEVAMEIAGNLVSFYGMDEDIGPISLRRLNSLTLEIFGQKALNNIGNKITQILKDAEKEAERILKEDQNRRILDVVSDELLKRETISGEELNTIFRKFESDSSEE